MNPFKMNSKGQGAVGVIIGLGALLVIGAIGLMVYNSIFGGLAFGAASGGAPNAVATLNLVNATFMPLIILVAAAIAILSIILTLRGRA